MIDTGMSEELKESLTKKAKVRIIPLGKPFTFAEQVRQEVQKHAAYDYVLFFDHDEIFPATLKQYLLENMKMYDYFFIPRKNFIFGKWIKHSRWWPDYQIRFLKKNSVYWDTAIYIHVQPQLKGKGIHLEPKEELAIDHHSYLSIDEYIDKLRFYAKAEATQLADGTKEYTLKNSIQKSLSELMSRYFTSEGYKDGAHGFVLGILQIFYYFMVYFYYWEKKKYRDIDQKELTESIDYFFNRGSFEVNYWLIQKSLITKTKKIKYSIKNKLLSLIR